MQGFLFESVSLIAYALAGMTGAGSPYDWTDTAAQNLNDGIANVNSQPTAYLALTLNR